jgi:phage baseplate assembly protein W
MTMADLNNSFLGRGWRFPPEFNKRTGAAELSADEQDVRESILIYLSTRRGERFLRPEYGSSLHEQVFTAGRSDVLRTIANDLKANLQLNEPRIIIHEINIDSSDIQNGKVLFSIDYEVESTNVRDNIVFPYYLVEGTHINR